MGKQYIFLGGVSGTSNKSGKEQAYYRMSVMSPLVPHNASQTVVGYEVDTLFCQAPFWVSLGLAPFDKIEVDREVWGDRLGRVVDVVLVEKYEGEGAKTSSK